MKKLFFMAILLASTLAYAEESPYYLGLGTGLDLPTNWGNYSQGGGANLFGGYKLDKDWDAQLSLEQWFYMGGTQSLYNLRVLAEGKYSFAQTGWRPYVLAGPGIVFQAQSPSGNTANFDALVGAGLQYEFISHTDLFLQAEYNFILPQNGSYQDLSLNAGVIVNL